MCEPIDDPFKRLSSIAWLAAVGHVVYTSAAWLAAVARVVYTSAAWLAAVVRVVWCTPALRAVVRVVYSDTSGVWCTPVTHQRLAAVACVV